MAVGMRKGKGKTACPIYGGQLQLRAKVHDEGEAVKRDGRKWDG